jgi:hypothetical protein
MNSMTRAWLGLWLIGFALTSAPGWAKDKPGEVRGAMWHVAAENVSTGKSRMFKFRVHDGVLYDAAGEKVGVVSPVPNTKPGEVKSRMVWKTGLPLEGDFQITQRKKGHWSGTLTTADGKEWKLTLDVVDR